MLLFLSSFPNPDSIHPIVIHFPIVLLLLSPVFILIGAILPPAKSLSHLHTALGLLLAGTLGLFVAVETGEAAAQLADRTPPVNVVLQAHQSLASVAQIVFCSLSVLLFALFAVTRQLRKPLTRLYTTTLPLVFLGLYSTGILVLVNTAHQGARLVHEFGVHATMSSQPDDPRGASTELALSRLRQ